MLPPILERVKDAGYIVFEEGQHNANIIGVRSMVRASDSFDDTLHYCARDAWGIGILWRGPCPLIPAFTIYCPLCGQREPLCFVRGNIEGATK